MKINPSHLHPVQPEPEPVVPPVPPQIPPAADDAEEDEVIAPAPSDEEIEAEEQHEADKVEDDTDGE